MAEESDKGGCGCLIMIIGFIGLIGSVFGFIPALSHIATPSYSPDVGSSLIALKAVPGHKVDLSLTGKSIQGLWASDSGLTLKLNHGSTFQIVNHTSQGWGSSIEWCYGPGCQNSPDSFTIPAPFTLPASYTPGATVSGTITGDLLTPQYTSGGFENQTSTLSIPVSVKVVKSFPHRPWVRNALIALAVFVVGFVWFGLRVGRS